MNHFLPELIKNGLYISVNPWNIFPSHDMFINQETNGQSASFETKTLSQVMKIKHKMVKKCYEHKNMEITFDNNIIKKYPVIAYVEKPTNNYPFFQGSKFYPMNKESQFDDFVVKTYQAKDEKQDAITGKLLKRNKKVFILENGDIVSLSSYSKALGVPDANVIFKAIMTYAENINISMDSTKEMTLRKEFFALAYSKVGLSEEKFKQDFKEGDFKLDPKVEELIKNLANTYNWNFTNAKQKPIHATRNLILNFGVAEAKKQDIELKKAIKKRMQSLLNNDVDVSEYTDEIMKDFNRLLNKVELRTDFKTNSRTKATADLFRLGMIYVGSLGGSRGDIVGAFAKKAFGNKIEITTGLDNFSLYLRKQSSKNAINTNQAFYEIMECTETIKSGK